MCEMLLNLLSLVAGRLPFCTSQSEEVSLGALACARCEQGGAFLRVRPLQAGSEQPPADDRVPLSPAGPDREGCPVFLLSSP